MWYSSADALFWQLPNDHKMNVQYQVAGPHTSYKVWHLTLVSLWCGWTVGWAMVLVYNFRWSIGFFKGKLQLSRTKIYLINQHSLTLYDHPIGQNTSWSRIYNFYFLISHRWSHYFNTTFLNKTWQNNCRVWLTIASVVQIKIAFEMRKKK